MQKELKEVHNQEICFNILTKIKQIFYLDHFYPIHLIEHFYGRGKSSRHNLSYDFSKDMIDAYESTQLRNNLKNIIKTL